MVYNTGYQCGPGLERRARELLMESSSFVLNRRYSTDSAIAVSWTSQESFEAERRERESYGVDDQVQNQNNLRSNNANGTGDRDFQDDCDETGSEKGGQKKVGNLSVGYDDGHRRASAPEYVCDKTGHRKLQSILRAEPQVFKVYDKNQPKKKDKKSKDPSSGRRVNFDFPKGSVVPERVNTKTQGRIPVHIVRAKKTLGALKQKFTGEAEAVPWRPSPHLIPMQHQTKFKRTRKISPPSSQHPVIHRMRELKLQEVKEEVKGSKSKLYRETEKEGAYLSKVHSDHEDEDCSENEEDRENRREENDHDADEDSENNSDDFESAAETTQDEYEDLENLEDEDENENKGEERLNAKEAIKAEVNIVKNPDPDPEEDDGDDRPKLSRRKAFGYHLKSINLADAKKERVPQVSSHSAANAKIIATANASLKKSSHSRKTPSFPTGGHGLGHADRHHHLHKNHKYHSGALQISSSTSTSEGRSVCPVHPNGPLPAGSDDDVHIHLDVSPYSTRVTVSPSSSPNSHPSPSFTKRLLGLNRRFRLSGSAATSDNESSDDVRSGRSSRANSVQMNENEILLNLVSGEGQGQDENGLGTSPGRTILIDGKPVKIVNARYRRCPSFDLFPSV